MIERGFSLKNVCYAPIEESNRRKLDLVGCFLDLNNHLELFTGQARSFQVRLFAWNLSQVVGCVFSFAWGFLHEIWTPVVFPLDDPSMHGFDVYVLINIILGHNGFINLAIFDCEYSFSLFTPPKYTGNDRINFLPFFLMFTGFSKSVQKIPAPGENWCGVGRDGSPEGEK